MKKSNTILLRGMLLITGLFFLSEGAVAQSTSEGVKGNARSLYQQKIVVGNSGPAIKPELDDVLLGENQNILWEKLTPVPVQETVTGAITDASDGQPLPGVNIVIKGTTTGTSSGIDGEYELTVHSLSDTLVFSFIGYQTREVPINGRTTIDVALQPQAILGEEVVVVGYGIQRKETATGSIATINIGEMKKAPVGNISQALVGKVPGVMSTQASGEPGQDGATLRIRGVSTLQSGGREPLVVVDGIERDFSVLNSLDINVIESVSVLKDASATAVYGVRGANGVIIFTTKRGNAGAPQVSFSSNFGFSTLAFPVEMIGSYEYALYRNEAVRMDDDPSLNYLIFSEDDLWKFQNNRDFTPAEVEAMDLTPDQKAALLASPALYYTNIDWFDEQFGSPGPQQQYNVNLSGGGENVRYFTSVGYFSQDGNIANSDYGGAKANSVFDRYNFRTNFDIDAGPNTQVSINVGGQIETFSGIHGKDGNITSQFSRNKEMTVVLYDAPFSGPGIVDGKLVNGYVRGAGSDDPLADRGGSGYSPTSYVLSRGIMINRTTNLNTSTEIVHTLDYLIPGLSVSGTFSYDNRYRKGRVENRSIPTYDAMRNPDNPAEILFFGGTVGPASVEDNFRNSKWRRFYAEGGVNYNQSFGNHTVTGLALVNAQKTFDPDFSFNVPSGLVGIVGRVTYNYDDRYLAEFNMGYTGSENFPEGNRFGFFPAVSAGWVISNEGFFPENNVVSLLKIRGSYGEVGNDRIGGRRYLYLPSTWRYGDDDPTEGYYFGETDGSSQSPFYVGARESSVGNPNVTWERAKKYNLGLEINLFEDRLTFVGDLFQENRDNILWPLGTVPDLVAVDLPPSNIGEVSNRGYEIEAGWRDIIGEVGYRLSGSISYARNKIEFMDEPSFPFRWMNATGFSLGQLKGYSNSGFYNSAAEANNRPFSTVDGNRVQAGDLRFIDIDGNGVLDIQDVVPIGHPNLPQYIFNFSVGFSYKGFQLSALFNGSARGSLPLADFNAFEDSPLVNPLGSRGGGGALRWHYDGRWTPEKAEQGIEPEFPRASFRTRNTQNAVPNSFWVQTSDFVRLKTAEISYTFPNIEWINIRNIRVYANGHNLFTFGSYVVDPEQQHAGAVDRGYLYPITSVYNFGVNVQF